MFGVWFLIRLLMVLGNRISRMWVIWLWTMGLRVCWDCDFYFYVVSHDPVPIFSRGAARELGGLWVSIADYPRQPSFLCCLSEDPWDSVLYITGRIYGCSKANIPGIFPASGLLPFHKCFWSVPWNSGIRVESLQKPLTSPHSGWLSSHPIGPDRRALLLHLHAWETHNGSWGWEGKQIPQSFSLCLECIWSCHVGVSFLSVYETPF